MKYFLLRVSKAQEPVICQENLVKRGKEIKKRGISKEQICVATALDRQGNLIIEPLCKGRMTHKELERAL